MRIKLIVCLLLISLEAESLLAQSLGITGDAADVSTTTTQGIVLMGGSTDVDAAIKWMINRSGGGDFVVIRASGTNAYNSYIYGLGSVNSVETFLINSSTLAQNAAIAQAIRNAEALFIAGGDQGNYVTYWRNSPIEDAINYLINTKKVPVGGTSAGCAILTKVYYSALSSSVTSSEALADPYGSMGQDVKYDDFINSPFLDNTISDSHYLARGRQGRHATFLARMIKDKGLTNVKGIGVDEKTAVCIDEAGKAIVFGSSSAVFIRQFCNGPETCVAGQKLTWTHGVKVYSVKGNTAGSNYLNLTDWTTGSGGSWEYWTINNGVITTGIQTPPLTCLTNTMTHALHLNRTVSVILSSNLVVDYLSAEVFMDTQEKVLIEIIDFQGRIIQTQTGQFNQGMNQLNLELPEIFPSGMYFLRVSSRSESVSVKFGKF